MRLNSVNIGTSRLDAKVEGGDSCGNSQILYVK